eukprot:764275-Hanusia_phi.AAC.1
MKISAWGLTILLLHLKAACETDARREGRLVKETILASSEFIGGEDGWMVLGEDVHLKVEGEYLTGSDEGQSVWFFSAPPKFLGDMRGAFHGSIKFSVGHFHANSGGKDPMKMEDVVLVSDLHNLTLIRAGIFVPWVNEQEVDVALEPRDWTHAVSQAPCSDEELLLTLSSLSGLLVRGGYYYGPEMSWIKVKAVERGEGAVKSEEEERMEERGSGLRKRSGRREEESRKTDQGKERTKDLTKFLVTFLQDVRILQQERRSVEDEIDVFDKDAEEDERLERLMLTTKQADVTRDQERGLQVEEELSSGNVQIQLLEIERMRSDEEEKTGGVLRRGDGEGEREEEATSCLCV